MDQYLNITDISLPVWAPDIDSLVISPKPNDISNYRLYRLVALVCHKLSHSVVDIMLLSVGNLSGRFWMATFSDCIGWWNTFNLIHPRHLILLVSKSGSTCQLLNVNNSWMQRLLPSANSYLSHQPELPELLTQPCILNWKLSFGRTHHMRWKYFARVWWMQQFKLLQKVSQLSQKVKPTLIVAKPRHNNDLASIVYVRDHSILKRARVQWLWKQMRIRRN